MTCHQCRLPVLAAVPYFVGREQRYFCLRCEDGYQKTKRTKREEPVAVRAPDTKPTRRKPASLPFAMQLETGGEE